MNFSAPLPVSGAAGSAPWRAGSLIGGRYRLLRRLGAGGMGEVWLAEHTTLGTTAAVKLVDIAARDNAGEILARFELEARAAAQLRSPNVVQILDHGVDGHVAFMVMELLEGEGLEERIARRGQLWPDEVAYIMTEVTRGIERAHAAGIIHRDLKPSNIFLARQADGCKIAKVLDFGIAKVLGTPKSAHVQTQAGIVIGTPSYMSPEQVLGRPLDARSDLWSLGVIVFECLCGQRLFDGETLGVIFMHICSAPLPVPSAIALVPPGFDAWFRRALARDPRQRFQSATEFSDALRASLGLANTPLMMGITTSNAGRGDPAPRPRARALLIASLLGGIMVACLVGIGWKLRAGRRTAADPAPVMTTSAQAPSAEIDAPPSPPNLAAIPSAPAPSTTASTTASPKTAKPSRSSRPRESPDGDFGF